MNSLCADIEERLASGQALTSAQRAHATGCASCTSLLRRFALAERLLAAASSPPPWLVEKALARIRRRRLVRAFLHEPFPWKWVALGMGFGVAMVCLWYLAEVPPDLTPRVAIDWDFIRQYPSWLAHSFRMLLAPLAAIALSILPFLIPVHRRRPV